MRSKSRMIGSLAQPVLFLLSLGYGFGSVFQKAGQGNYIEFLAPGIIGMGIIFTAVFSGIEIIWDKQFGFLKETLVAPVSRFSIIVNFLIMPLFFLSGALFPLTNLPAIMNVVVRLDPLSYGVDAFRGLLIGVTHFGLAMDMSVLLGFALVFVTLGSYSFSKVQI